MEAEPHMEQDIVARLRQEVVREPEVGRLLADAAREIERLRRLVGSGDTEEKT